MDRFPHTLLRLAVLIPAGAAIIAATVWLCLPGGAAPAASIADASRNVTGETPVTPAGAPQGVASDPDAEWLAYMDKVEQLTQRTTTPADRQYFSARNALNCRTIYAERKTLQAQAGQQSLTPEMQQAIQESWKEEDEMCASVGPMTDAQIAAQLEQAAQAGQKDAQLHLLQQRIDAAGLATMPLETDKPVVLTPQQKQQREQLVASVQALANTGHRDAMSLLADVKMATAAESGDFVTPFALSMLATLDWSKPLPTSLSDEALSAMPEEMRADVLRRAGELYYECCANAPNKNPYASPADVLGPPPPMVAQGAGNVADIFRVQKN